MLAGSTTTPSLASSYSVFSQLSSIRFRDYLGAWNRFIFPTTQNSQWYSDIYCCSNTSLILLLQNHRYTNLKTVSGTRPV